nr:carboxypeptidase-like regulatory domain-containing protein [Bacteroidota bacterium]
MPAFGQLTKIMGVVTDSKTGEPMPFVNVVFKGTNIGITTGFDGDYSIETKRAGDSLIASFVGYQKQIKHVEKGKFQYINFAMVSMNIELETVVITAGENPAEVLLRKIVGNKPKNDPDKYDAYEYEAYNKIEIDANNITEKFKERRIFRHFQFIFDNVDTSTVNGKTYLPIFLSESISGVYAKRNPRASIEIIKATKVSGIENESVMQFLGDKFQHTNIYDNYIELFQKNFVSPIANFGVNFYKYYLIDSAFFNNKWCYKVMFKPRHRQTLTFTGHYWVHDTTFAIKQVEMRIVDDANINFINDLVLAKEFDLIDNKYWLLTKDYIIGDLNLIEDDKTVLGFFGRKTTTYRNYIINQPRDEKFYASPVSVVVSEGATKKDDEFWIENRHEELTRDEKTIYFMIDTLKTIPRFNTYIDIIQMVTTGYYETGNFELGPYASVLSFNAVEGARFRFGGRTSNKFSKRVMLFGHVAYGTLDSKWKYGGGFLYMLNKNPRRTFGGSFKYDLEQLGASQNAFREDFFLAFLFRRNPADKLSMVEEGKVHYEHEWFNGFSNTVNIIHRNLYPIGKTEFGHYEWEDGQKMVVEETAITSTEIRLDTRLAYKERFLAGEFERISLGAKYPILEIRYGYGIPERLNGDYEYHKLQLGISHWFNFLNLGWSKYIIEAGRIWGTVPYPLLKLHEGNETYFFDESAFNMMNYYEFVSDKYISAYYTHHFDGFFFNRLPLFRKLKWREVAFARGLVGGMDKANKDFSVFPDGLYTLDKPYFEAGAGIENILKIFRVDAIWRLSYLDHPDISKFGIRFSMQFSF